MIRAIGGAAMLAIVAMSAACEDTGTNLLFSEFFVAILSGDEEVDPVVTDAEGGAFFDWDGTTMTYVVSANEIQNVTAAHIHQGEMGENGPIVVTLFAGPTDPGPQFVAEGEFSEPDEGVSLTMEELLELMRTGGTYVNVHTEANPGGEIRGQIESPTN